MDDYQNQFETFCDSFDNDLQKWTLCATAHRGRWKVINKELVYNIAPPYNLARGFIRTRNWFQNIQNITMDFFMPEDGNGELDIWLFSFHYMAIGRIAQETDGSNQAVYLHSNAKKYTSKQPLLCQKLKSGEKLRCGEWNNCRLEIVNQTFTIYLNGQPVLVYTDSEYPVDDISHIQLKTSVDGMRFRNFSVQANKILPPQSQISEQQKQNVYIAQMNMERTRPYGFLEPAGEEHWGMTLVGGQPVYGVAASTEFRHTWLHGFEKDGEVTAEILCTQPAEDAVCGIFARFAVEDSYLRAGYDFKEKVWFIAASFGKIYRTQYYSSAIQTDMEPNKYYQLRLVYTAGNAQLYVNDELTLVAEGVDNISYGRIGMFTKGAGLYARSFTCSLLSGKITDGIMEQTVAPDKIHSHLELERIDERTLYGQFERHRYISYDLGEHFAPAPAEYTGTIFGNTSPPYPSIHRRKSDGKFIQVSRDKEFFIQESDDLKNWTTICHFLPRERAFDEKGRCMPVLHVSTFTELSMSDGSTRLFLPLGFHSNHGEHNAAGHYTIVFYSDDGGKTWKESKKNVQDLPNFSPWHGNMSWCESKIIRCADGRLRMLGTRKMAPFVYYADSFDDGETWTSYGELTDMPTPISSFAICEDPVYPGSYLMVYVNNQPHWYHCIFPRTRLTLVRTDGLKYENVMDVERFTNSEDPMASDAELYQILDPCINVFEDYIFISFGRSNNVGIAESCHHGQRARFVRIDRKKAGI